MGDLHFIFGAMSAGKTAELIFTYDLLTKKHNAKPVILAPSIDTRSGLGWVKSRNSLMREAIPIYPDINLFELIKQFKFTHVLVDEAHLFTTQQIDQLVQACDYLQDIHTITCFGLLTDFKGETFPSSLNLITKADFVLNLADKCQHCNENYAVYNMRLINGVPVFEGEQIAIEGEVQYHSVCRVCYEKAKSKFGGN